MLVILTVSVEVRIQFFSKPQGGKARTSTKSPVGTVKTFIKAMGDGDADIIISLFVSTGQNMWQGIPTNLGTDKIKTFLHRYLKRAGYRRTETAAGMKEAESSFSLEKFYHGKMKNRIPEIV